ncbi:MAG: hypothetical protein H6978_06645 [Gammaproteobacteria bacterium]|nr:hypothetical protein [Gammaproteobacteria bacterium]
MAISPDVASLAVSVVSGALKLSKRLDEIQAEETALRSAISLPFPAVALNPSAPKMRTALRTVLRSVELDATARGHIEQAVADGDPATLTDLCRRYGVLESIATPLFKPDRAFAEALLARSSVWNLEDAQVRDFTFFLAADTDLRANSLGFRIGATVLDVLTEVAAQNTRFVINHEPTRELVESVLVKFAEPDLGTMTGWGAVLRQALTATLQVAIDERESLAGGREWVERLLSAVARAGAQAPNADDFLFGLFQGKGINELLRSVLTEGADYLSEDDAEVWEQILADVLVHAAEKAGDASDFEAFFHDNWHSLIGAGFAALQRHGPRLLDEDEAILNASLTAAVGALADAFEHGPPNKQTFIAVVEAAINVFADPGILAEDIRQDWLREVIVSVAGTVADTGLRKAFTQPALERYARDTLGVLSRYPEVIAADNTLVNSMLSNVLGRMAAVRTFGVASLADATVAGALTAVASNKDLLHTKFADIIGEVAGNLAERVAYGGISTVQAETLVGLVVDAVAANEQLFVKLRGGLAQAVTGAVLDAAEQDPKRLLGGAALIAAMQRVLGIVAVRGRTLPADAQVLTTRLNEVVAGALDESGKVIGQRLAQEDVPIAVVALVERFATTTNFPQPGTPEFKALFATLLAQIYDVAGQEIVA